MKKIFILTAMMILSILFFCPSSVFAQRVSLSITPPFLEIIIKPGESPLVAYTISNHGDPTVIAAYVRPFTPKGQFGELTIGDEFEGPIRFNLENSDIKLEDPFFLKTKEGQQLLLKIRVPEGAPEGDYYYTFFGLTEAGGNIGSTNNTSQARAAIGSNILITVTKTGETDIKGHVARFATDPLYSLKLFGKTYHIFESTDTIPVTLIITNSGKNYIKPKGDIILTGNFGEKATYNLLPENILSQSSRLIHATPSAQIIPKKSLVLKGFFVGKYRLFASFSFGEGTEQITSETIFYAIPFKLIFATLVVLIVGITLIKKFSKDYS